MSLKELSLIIVNMLPDKPTTFEWNWYVTADGVVFEWSRK
jgi:hypothetical protein